MRNSRVAVIRLVGAISSFGLALMIAILANSPTGLPG
jgi:hypothetical protein